LREIAGPAPQELLNLVDILALSVRAGKLEIYHIDWLEDRLEILFSHKFQMPAAFPADLINHYGADNLEFVKSKNGDGVRLISTGDKTPLAFTAQVLAFLETILTPQK